MHNRIWQLFTFGLWMGTTVFGGAAAAYPLIRAKSEERGWLGGEDVDALYAVAVFLPGPSFLNLWGAVAARVAGMGGALIAQVGLLLPAFLLVWALPLLSRLEFVASRTEGILQATLWATAGLLLGTGVEGLVKLNERRLRCGAGALLGLLLLGAHPLLLMAVSVAAGVALSMRNARKEAA